MPLFSLAHACGVEQLIREIQNEERERLRG